MIIERWVDGLATIEEVRHAADAALAAYAAFRVVRAADAAGTAYAAADAADAAAYDTVLRQCADIVRSMIGEDVMREAWEDDDKEQL